MHTSPMTILAITAIAAGVAALSAHFGVETRHGFEGAPRFDLR